MTHLHLAARHLRTNWPFTAVTTLTLGLGIGIITALFAVVDAVLLQPITTDQNRVVRIWMQDVERDGTRHSVSYPEFLALREQSRTFAVLGAIDYGEIYTVAATLDDRPMPLRLTPVSSDFLEVLHPGAPLLGRWFEPRDESKDAELTAVVSERFWRRIAGGDRSFVGRQLRWGGDRTLRVIGVADSSLDYPLGTDAWVPIPPFFNISGHPVDPESRGFAQFELIGRLAPTATREEAHAELAVLHRRLVQQFPDDYRHMQLVVAPILDTLVGSGRQLLLFLFTAAGLVFAISGINVAVLLLMRASERRKETAIRVAIGASHARLVRQAITEGVLIGGLGAVTGILIAIVLLGILRGLAPTDVPRIEHAALDVRVLAFCIVAVMLWVLALGTTPLWVDNRVPLNPGNGSYGLTSRGIRGTRGLRVFTVTQIAAAVVVAVGAGLLVRSFVHLRGIDRGFDSNDLAVVQLLLPDSRYPDAARRLAFYEQLIARLGSVPGVITASPVHMMPGTASLGLSAPMRFEGQTAQDAKTNPWATWEPVTPSFFRTLGVPIIQGRDFTEVDGRDSAPVAIVSDAVARRYWPGQDPIGRRLRLAAGPEWPWVTVVGVAADTRYRELTKGWMTVYFPAAQFFFFDPGSLVVRTATDPEAIVRSIRRAIRSHEPAAAVASVDSMNTLLARELSRPRTALTVTGLFALTAILLSAVGVYGVMSYEVRQRRRELAVRSALGATPRDIFRAVVHRTLALGAAGAGVGIAAAALVTRSIRAFLFEVGPGDPLSFAIGAGALLVIVLLASSVPARRAARVDPVTALRVE